MAKYSLMRALCLPALTHARSYPARYQRARKAGIKIDRIVLHDTYSKGTFEQALKYLSHPTDRPVSIHYLIGRDLGQIYAMVPEHKKANHVKSHNSRSIGIELYKTRTETGDFTDWQYASVSQLVFDIPLRHGLPHSSVTSHAVLDPKRRSDPRDFDWARFDKAVPRIGDLARFIDPAFTV